MKDSERREEMKTCEMCGQEVEVSSTDEGPWYYIGRAYRAGMIRSAEIAKNWNPNDFHYNMPQAIAEKILKEAQGGKK